jgi:predicted dehydrogenase
VSSVAYEPSAFGQLHQWELHGSAGTLHVTCDWNATEELRGAHVEPGDEAVRGGTGRPLDVLPIPDRLYEGLRRDTVHNTYKDTFRERDNMARGFVTAIATGGTATPSFRDAWAVQRIVDAAGRSAREGRRVTIEEIAAGE